MDMKVNGPNDPRLTGAGSVGGAQPAELDGARHANRAHQARSGDEANLSERARLLQKARAAFDATPDTRREKVTPLKQAVADGQYRVDFRTLVERLLYWMN